MYTSDVILPVHAAKKRFSKRSTTLSSPLSVLNRAKTKPFRYISALAHEVRNPLSSINLALDMLKETTKLDPEQVMYIDMIKRGSLRIQDLVDTLLVSDPFEDAHAEFYSLHQLLEEVLLLAKDLILIKKITVCRDYAATEQLVMVDKDKIKIALTNIVINAIDSMPAERGELKLVTKFVSAQSTLEIQDNGLGISTENLKKIFKPYFTNKPGGMGLGLSATLDILRANQVSVDVRSEVGQGTCFTLSFCQV